MDEPSEFEIFSGPLRAELELRAEDCNWSVRQRCIVADICDWQLAMPARRPGYEGQEGRPNFDLRAVIQHVHEAALARARGGFAAFRRNADGSSLQTKCSQRGKLVLWERTYPWALKDKSSRPTQQERQDILALFGAAHAVLCDTIPKYRPKLYSAWDRRPV